MIRSFICLLSLLATVYADANCPAGYSNRDTVHCYKVYTTPKTKDAAASKCESDGGYLSTIANGFDNSYVNSLGQTSGVASMWLGIECSAGNKTSCVNDDGTDFGPYDNFYPGNPSAIGDCVYQSTQNRTSASWLSFDCNNLLPFLCEFDYESQCPSGYTKFAGNCYRVGLSADEDEAELACEKDCGHLTSIHSDKENMFLTDLAAAQAPSSYMVRIGLKASTSEFDSWIDQSFFDYSNIGYRNNGAYQCYGLSLVDRLVNRTQWASESCDSVIPYICKTVPGTCETTQPPTQSPPVCGAPQSFSGAGTVYSPGYPVPYVYNPQCIYFITTAPGTVVEVYFPFVELVTGASISFYNDLADEKPFAKISSSSTGNFTFKSSENEMVVVFSYPYQFQGGIWEFQYKPADYDHLCPLNYYMNNGICYKYNQQQATKAQASNICKADGGSLAIIPNKVINDFLVNMMSQYSKDTVYIGLACNKVKTDGDSNTCVWDDGTTFTFNGFESGNPRQGSYCVDFNMGEWESHDCDDQHPFICQAPPRIM